MQSKQQLWKPGQSGNPAGRPVGSRNRFSEKFLDDLGEAWTKHGVAALEKTAKDEPARFVYICSRLVPKDIQVTLSGRLPGVLEPEDWQLAMSVFQAIKETMPEAEQQQPASVLKFVRAAIRAASAKVVENCTPVANMLLKSEYGTD